MRGIDVHLVSLPLDRPLVAAHGRETARELIVVSVETEGARGWGECSTLSAPTYSPSWTRGAFDLLTTLVAPKVLAGERPRLVGHEAVTGALDDALLDASLRSQGRGLRDHLALTRDRVPVGAVIGLGDREATVARARELVELGVERLKLKVRPGWDVEPVAAVREVVGPGVEIQIDANGSYSPEEANRLVVMAELGVGLVEQPVTAAPLSSSAALRRRWEGSGVLLALDESLDSAGRLTDIVALDAADAVVIKPGRHGGLDASWQLAVEAAGRGLAVSVGGMHESGVGRPRLLGLAAIEAVNLVGDTGPPEAQHIELAPRLELGRVWTGEGLGPEPDLEVLERFTLAHRRLK